VATEEAVPTDQTIPADPTAPADESGAAATGSAAAPARQLGSQLRDIPLSVGVRVGRAKLSLQSVIELRDGQLVELDRDVGAPVDVLANGVIVARGEIVEVNEEYGVRILELVVGPAKRTIFSP